ncbi:superoxide dismutase family protein [Rubrivirga litoralis]|uniref:Superoxide dismutase family protein n=1 Tax=Rubrivirga litoralis TaxID=3075598 RepID=A0ABU3BVA1_9BACT|nr:superoxide dismutase family protein [Rubrivirga sp. F394]MDT0633221.1 superoxide dismutase family protein [Rubrivirga sp. F394]
MSALLLLAACAEPAAPPSATSPPPRPAALAPGLAPDTVEVSGVGVATARVEPVGAGRVDGTVQLRQTEGGVRVQADLRGLSQSDFHAFQILRGRDCGADPDVHLGAEAGRHGGPYALPGDRHAGDLGNVRGDRGRGRYDRIDPALNLDGTGSPVGRAVVVRAERDDAVSDGTGGAVVGCGVLVPQ